MAVDCRLVIVDSSIVALTTLLRLDITFFSSSFLVPRYRLVVASDILLLSMMFFYGAYSARYTIISIMEVVKYR